eukprot:gnl/TRDRNA2_/TRDRNA2_152460_c4_seq2.p1 gnl/TRDRNA2_/TRDRNA2_152460_c4~~gnl/TRDRNA2_/TRDRNA2_152460_c4_seq2.p1  ORF type:complete len:144 (+),score=10.04 gnl/TRDRNA2_/TRDRNA2_152460_c4_seq2:290-721(+)
MTSIDGLLHRDQLRPEDYWLEYKDPPRLVGKNSRKTWRLGQGLTVMIIASNPETGRLDFALPKRIRGRGTSSDRSQRRRQRQGRRERRAKRSTEATRQSEAKRRPSKRRGRAARDSDDEFGGGGFGDSVELTDKFRRFVNGLD